MIIAILGLVLGIVLGYYIPITYPESYSLYVSVAILASLDSVFGAIRSNLEGRYDNIIFISGFFSNAILAAILSYIGDKLGVPLYYAPIIGFGGNIFRNLGAIRRMFLERILNKNRSI